MIGENRILFLESNENSISKIHPSIFLLQGLTTWKSILCFTWNHIRLSLVFNKQTNPQSFALVVKYPFHLKKQPLLVPVPSSTRIHVPMLRILTESVHIKQRARSIRIHIQFWHGHDGPHRKESHPKDMPVTNVTIGMLITFQSTTTRQASCWLAGLSRFEAAPYFLRGNGRRKNCQLLAMEMFDFGSFSFLLRFLRTGKEIKLLPPPRGPGVTKETFHCCTSGHNKKVFVQPSLRDKLICLIIGWMLCIHHARQSNDNSITTIVTHTHNTIVQIQK